jgi:hypothetical protein
VNPAPTDDVIYLFQEETSHARRYFVLALIAFVIAVVGWQWRELHNLGSKYLKNYNVSQPGVATSSEANGTPSSEQAPAPQGADINSGQNQPVPPDHSHETQSQGKSDSASEASKGQIEPASAGTAERDTSESEGEKYLYGNGVPADCNRARQNLLLAAEHSNPKAESTLGTMYATGHCTTRDLPLAYHWFERAQRRNPRNRILAEDMKVLWDQMSPEERDLAKR